MELGNVYNCKHCKRLFSFYKEYPFCNKCDDEIFGKIKDYLKENPGANGHQVSLDTGISTKIIAFYIKEGRLDAYKHTLRVCICGASLEEGQTRCPDCMEKIRKWSEAANNEIRHKVEQKLESHGFHSSLNDFNKKR